MGNGEIKAANYYFRIDQVPKFLGEWNFLFFTGLRETYSPLLS